MTIRFPSAFAAIVLLALGLSGLQTTAQEAKPPRTPPEIQKDLQSTGEALREVMPASPEALADAAKRTEIAPKAIPLFRKMSNLMGEFATAVPEIKPQVASAQFEIRAMLALLGEKEAEDELARLSISKDLKEATDAKSWGVAVRWVKATKDAAAQERLANELSGIARQAPENPMIAQAASLMADTAATPALAEQVEKIIADQLKSPGAKEIAADMAAKRKIKAIENKPLVIEGLAADGTKFSTASLKGKVVLIDFWATWCGPCMAELPEVKKVYAEYKDEGLVIVGVSCDRDILNLKKFQQENADAPWVQLFDPAAKGWHPLAEQYGVTGIPTMFLIDKKGICRTVSARENYKEMIPKLLAEKE